MIKIYIEEKMIEECSSVIIIPEKSVDEPGYIQTLTVNANASSKHEFHAMAQMAYFQYQDDELEVTMVHGEIKVESGDRGDVLASGMVLYRDLAGFFHVFMHDGLNKKKLLETAYRFCTRWVRLDI